MKTRDHWEKFHFFDATVSMLLLLDISHEHIILSRRKDFKQAN